MKIILRPWTELALVFGVALSALSSRVAGAPVSWTDSGAGFRAGALGNSGQNLYVNRRGELETIRRFDVDGDGFLDLLSNSGHDMYYALPATMARAGSRRSIQVSELGVDGSSRVIPADLNRDGFMDLVFLPNVSNIQYAHRSSLRIAWGAQDGWSSSRLTHQLPINGGFGAEDSWLPTARLAVGDLNGDGWPDLLTLNSEGWLFGQPSGRIVRAYWGGPEGFMMTRYRELGIAGAIEVAAGAFGTQGEFSAVALSAKGELSYLSFDSSRGGLRVARTLQLPLPSNAGAAETRLQCMIAQSGGKNAGDTLWIGTDSNVLFQVGPAGRPEDVRSIAARPATSLAIGRLDDDAFPDLALTNLKLVFRSELTRASHAASITIMWGTADGVSAERSAELSISNAISTTIGDLDDDRHGDLLVSVHQGDTTMKASSLVFFGDGSRQIPSTSAPMPTEGAQGAVITRVTPTSAPVAIIANSMSYTLDAAVPALLYWGTAQGFSAKARTEIPNLGGLKSSLSDLNNDGYVDLILINGGDVTPEAVARAPNVGANIYWGGAEGSIRGPGPTRFDASRRQILREPFLCSINVADFNGDGFLDIVLGAYEGRTKPDTDVAIYYGSAAGYSAENRKTVHIPSRGFGLAIADYNRDGRLDFAIVGYANDLVTTYWGGADGFSESRQSAFPYPAPIELETADLNNDGWLDLFVCSYFDPITHNRDTGISIYWGGPKGWHQSNSQWLPSHTTQAIAVADLDGDGFLDFVTPNYHGELTREHLPSFIYWGSSDGYSALRRTSLKVDSGVDVMAVDIDRDGKLDLAFTAHSVNAGHRVNSPVYFNDGRRFESPRVQYYPVIGPFYSWEQDPGNIYTRRYEETFTSRVFSWTDTRQRGRMKVESLTRFGAKIGLQVRSAADDNALAAAPWRPVSGEAFKVGAADRRFQYRLDFTSANGDAYPVVRQVGVTLD